MEAIKTIEYKGYKINVYPDDYSESPRHDDNLGTMTCFNRRYELGDASDLRPSDFSGWEDLRKHLEKTNDIVVILPLYLYDHSGLRIKVGSFRGMISQGHAEFDSGQVGFIYATAGIIRRNYGLERISKQCREKVERQLRAEVSLYDDYLAGYVYGYDINELPDAGAFGYFGDSGQDAMIIEAQAEIDADLVVCREKLESTEV